MTTAPRVFVSGCFDLLHSGHVQFLQEAAAFGQLHVAVGSDSTIFALKGRHPICRQDERLFMVQALACVHEAFLSSGSGLLDFEPELRQIRPDLFVVNADGDSPGKRELCQSLGVEYRVLQRVPGRGLPARSTTDLRAASRIPYRIDLAGGWLDQPFVSRWQPGAVIVVGLEPSAVFSGRSGLATSTRAAAERLWGVQLPAGDPEELARILFACENPPGTKEISGSQDSLGIALPGLSRLEYDGEYWPRRIETCRDPETLAWLESKLFVRWLGERAESFEVLGDTHITRSRAADLALAADACWTALNARNSLLLGAALRASFAAQLAMFPRMAPPAVHEAIAQLPAGIHGHKLAGAGGGGYLVVIADDQPAGFERIHVRHAVD